MTLAAIQKHLGIRADGLWGPRTEAAIKQAIGMVDAPPPPSDDLHIGPEGIQLIQSFEGCHKKRGDGRYDAYPDPGTGGDPWTIGWGSTGRDIKPGVVWTQEQCDERFERDLDHFAAGVAAALGSAPTSQAQFDAMTSMAYNVGLGALKGSTLLGKHKAGDYAGAESEFGRWTRAGGKVLKGLVRRRAAEAQLYRSGT